MKPEKVDLVIDAKNATLGRLASYSAKRALMGKTIAIVNCNEALVVGKPKMIINEYKETRQRGGASLHGPFFPKSPERIVKRTIRGMLSYKQARGKEAFRRIKCYNEIPDEYKDAKRLADGKEKSGKTIKLANLSKEI